MDLADILRRLDNLVRPGTIAAVDHDAARCRVQAGGLLTTWLPWLTLRAGNTRSWTPPTAGEQVLLLCPSGELAAGLVLCGIYTTAHPQPSNSADEHVTEYPDGARITYNHATSALSATGIKTALVEASEHVTVDCPESTITGNVLIKGTLIVEKLLTYLSGMTGYGGSAGGRTRITDDFIHEQGNLSSNGIVLHTHTHTGVQPGSGSTGQPQ